VRRGAVLAAGLGLALPGLAALALAVADRLLPPPLERLARPSTQVLDRDGGLLRPFATEQGTWRLPVALEAVDPLYLDLLLAVEDRRFWWHPGVDPLALARAAGQAIGRGRVVSGASTLTMQVARLLEPRPRTLVAKAIEALRALQLEWRLGKRGVLEAYLALAPMGGNLEGVRAGSLAWLGREPERLSPAEAALLVALPQAPARLRPDHDPTAARRARDRVLARAVAAGRLDPAGAAAARAAAVPEARRPMPFLAPHLAEQRARAAAPGAILRTTLDGELQRAVERLARDQLDRLPAPVDLAALVVEPASGAVRALLGSGDWGDRRRAGMLDLTRAVRSPGSTLKPFVYGLAFDAGLAHPGTLVRDQPLRFEGWAPGNFDGGFDGDLSIREALQRSLNLPAVQVAERVGPLVIARRLGLAGLRLELGPAAAAPGLPLVLGGVGTRLVDLAQAYTAIARDGTAVALRDDPAAPVAPLEPLLAPDTARAVAAILAETPRPAGIPAGARRVAYKTGTSHRFRDGWAIGFDGGHLVAVWIGRADGGSCAPCNGPGGAAPLLFRILALLPERPLPPLPPGHPLGGPPPPALARLEARPHTLAEAPRIAFPVPGSTVLLAPGEPLPLRASGGRAPYRWLVDEVPLAPTGRRREASWRPEEDGFAELRVVDAAGRSAAATIRIERPEPPLSRASPSRTRPAP
jgi:penicillin-binding protein 1C